MVYSAQAIKQCGTCGTVEDPPAKFCSHCGGSNWSGLAANNAYTYATLAAQTELFYPPFNQNGTPTLVLPENMPNSVPLGMARALTNLSDSHVPKFAHVRHEAKAVLRERQVELAKLVVVLARERLFLLFHFALFAVINVIGFWLSLKCYNEFIGDEMTRIMIGCSPFWIFNILGLTCIIPINGTRSNIARLKDQISHLKISIEYGRVI